MCSGITNNVRISDINGMSIMAFYQVGDEYIGGILRDSVRYVIPSAHSSLMRITTDQLLGMISEFAAIEQKDIDPIFTVSNAQGDCLSIYRVMHGKTLAKILKCDVNKVNECFEHLVKIV